MYLRSDRKLPTIAKAKEKGKKIHREQKIGKMKLFN